LIACRSAIPLRVPGVGFCPQVCQLPAQLFQARALLAGIGFLGQRDLLNLEPGDPPGDLVQFGRQRVDFGAQPRTHASSTRSIALSGRKTGR